MSEVALRRTIPHIGPLQIAIIILAVATAFIHLDRAIAVGFFSGHLGSPLAGGGHFPGPGPAGGHFSGTPRTGGPGPAGGRFPGAREQLGRLSFLRFLPLPLLFFLNFPSYIVLATVLYLAPFQRVQQVIRWALIALAAITIIAWFLITGAQPNVLGYIDKPIELALIVLLLIESVREARFSKRSPGPLHEEASRFS